MGCKERKLNKAQESRHHLGCAGLQHMELVDSEAQLVQVNIEIHKDVWRQRRGEHFLARKLVSLSVKRS